MKKHKNVYHVQISKVLNSLYFLKSDYEYCIEILRSLGDDIEEKEFHFEKYFQVDKMNLSLPQTIEALNKAIEKLSKDYNLLKVQIMRLLGKKNLIESFINDHELFWHNSFLNSYEILAYCFNYLNEKEFFNKFLHDSYLTEQQKILKIGSEG